jgi:hypothetical protein
MTKLQREITKKAGCNILDLSIADTVNIKKDLIKRRAKVQKSLEKAVLKGWDTFCIEDGLRKIDLTLAVL